MTQKELLYIEDAIGHENIMIKTLNYYLTCVSDKCIEDFLAKEVKKHESYMKKLLKFMEDMTNE